MWFDCTKTALKKMKVAYNNSSRRFMILPWRNSASEMFANLCIPSLDELLRIFVFCFWFLVKDHCFKQIVHSKQL